MNAVVYGFEFSCFVDDELRRRYFTAVMQPCTDLKLSPGLIIAKGRNRQHIINCGCHLSILIAGGTRIVPIPLDFKFEYLI